MASQNRPSKIGDLVGLGFVGGGVYFVYHDAFPLISWLILGGAVGLYWVCLLMPTWCDYQTQRGTPCTRRVRGKLRGCHHHSRLKRDALFQVVMGIRNPGKMLRVMWSAPGDRPPVIRATRPGTVRETESTPTKQSVSDAITLVATIVGSLAGVLALFL